MKVKTEEKVIAVEVGEEVEVRYPGATLRTVKGKVLAPCSEKHSGHWYCVTHREHFANNFMKDTHIGEPGTHKLAWICHQHGIEKP